MPQQLIYTSAPRGLVAGRSGHCTVARSALMREALMLQLEKLCYYQHLSLSGGQDRPIFTCRMIDIRGTRFHVLSRIQDAGLDFTGRTNFIAHHLVFTPEEIRQFPTPPVILAAWQGWVTLWAKEPQLLENEDWSHLTELAGQTALPAQTWQQVTGDAANGYGLLEARAGASFRVDAVADETILRLFAESLELLEVRDARKDFRAAAWQYTFTTSMQEQDNPADFRWRCIHSDNPTASRFSPPDCRDLSAVRTLRCTDEEKTFARSGRQPPRFIAEPQDLRISGEEPARLTAKADGVPGPAYQWFSVDRANNSQLLPGETNAVLLITNPAIGVSRYVVSATNGLGNVQSRVATLSVEKKIKRTPVAPDPGNRSTIRVSAHRSSGEDTERQFNRMEAAEAEALFEQKQRRNKILMIFAAVILMLFLVIGALAWNYVRQQQAISKGQPQSTNNISSDQRIGSTNGSQNSATNLPEQSNMHNAETNQSAISQAVKTSESNAGQNTQASSLTNFQNTALAWGESQSSTNNSSTNIQAKAKKTNLKK